MAKQTDAGKAAMAQLPAGFRKVNRARSQVWYRPEGATALCGTLLGRFVGKKGPYYQLKTNSEASWKDKQKGKITAPPLTVVNISEKADLVCLADIEPGVVVCIVALEKVDIGDGKTLWTFDVGVIEADATGEVD
jgi:hypothetical protein